MAGTEVPPLPLLDKQRVSIDAPADEVWTALGRALMHFTNTGLAVLLGAVPSRAVGDPLAVGSSIPGFTVVQSTRPERLVLTGRHRYAAYSLAFTVLDRGPGSGSRLIAASYAEFPGIVGWVYRALVIRSGAHEKVMRRLLRRLGADVRQRAGVMA